MQQEKYTVLKFSADYCNPCQQLQGLLGIIDVPSNIKIESYDIENEDNLQVANKYRVRSIPTLIMIDDAGCIIKTNVGNMNMQQLEDFFEV